MILSSPHVHTQFCDGRSTAEDMVRSALDHGFGSLGFSSHGKQYFDNRYAMDDEREAQYIAEVHRLQEKYKKDIRIWLGTELDPFCYSEKSRYDYVIGSVHLLPAPGAIYGVDGTKEQILKLRAEAFEGDGLRMAEAYFHMYGAYQFSHRPHIAGHMDLIRKNNVLGDLFDENDPRYRAAALSALQMTKQSGAIIEVNTGAMSRYNFKTPYPARFLLEEWLKMGGEVILSSDCHDAQHIMTGYAESIDLLLSVGFKTVRMLGTGDQLFETTELSPIK